MIGKKFILAAAVVSSFLIASRSAMAGDHLIGVGVHYRGSLTNIVQSADEFRKDLSQEEFSWLASYQYVPASLVKLEGDVEFINADGLSVLPQAYLLLGAGVYGGIGIGLPCVDGSFANDPLYNFRAGLDVEVVPDLLRLDVNANYEFTNFDQLNTLDEDNVTLGLIIRLQL